MKAEDPIIFFFFGKQTILNRELSTRCAKNTIPIRDRLQDSHQYVCLRPSIQPSSDTTN
jgi:hypothetical protein